MTERGAARIAGALRGRAGRRGPTLVAYLMAGDPSIETTADIALRCIERGIGMVELGVPFSDPIADGPVIAQAGQRAIDSLGGRSTVDAALAVARLIRRERGDVPIVLMGYANSLLAAVRARGADGLRRLAEQLTAAGVDGLLIPDLPYDHEPVLRETLTAYGIALPALVAPTTTMDRMAAVARAATGFIYYVSVTGVTGSDRPDPEDTRRSVARVREHTALPIIAGFGIQTPDQVRDLRAAADGLVVGTALVRAAHVAPPGQEASAAVTLAAGLAAAAAGSTTPSEAAVDDTTVNDTTVNERVGSITNVEEDVAC